MQKKLLTLAVAGALGAPAVALAQVEVYGTIHMSLNYMDYGTDVCMDHVTSGQDTRMDYQFSAYRSGG